MESITQQFITDVIQYLGLIGAGFAVYWNMIRKRDAIVQVAGDKREQDLVIESHGKRLEKLEEKDESFQACVRKSLHDIDLRLASIEQQLNK